MSTAERNCVQIALKIVVFNALSDPTKSNWAQYERILSAIGAQNDHKILFQVLTYKYYYERNPSLIDDAYPNI